MESLNKISKIGNELTDDKLSQITGGKKKHPWWWNWLEGLGVAAEAGSSLWQLKYPG